MNVIFFPRKDFDIEICAHRHGKKMTYTDQTDSLNSNNVYDWYMTMTKERNIKVGAFLYYDDLNRFPQAIEDYKNNKIWFDIYSQTPSPELLLNEDTATEENFNNYYYNVWRPVFLNHINKIPVALSYRIGLTYFSEYVPNFFLAARNSNVNNETNYGVGYGQPSNIAYDKNNYKSIPSTIRWYDAIKGGVDKDAELQIVSNLIDATLLNGGWIRNFTHWHNPYDGGAMEQGWVVDYLNLLASKNANNEIYFAGFGEAVAYLVFRSIITRSVMYSPKQNPGQLIIRLETQNTLGINPQLLQVPISVKFSLFGTPLAGAEIKSNRNLISLGNDNYIVELPFERFPYAIIERL